MSIEVINRTIRYMCSEIATELSPPFPWESMSEAELLHEIAVCVCSSQMLFELAVATADRLRDDSLLQPDAVKDGFEELEARMASALSTPVSVAMSDGPRKSYRPRFKNRLASLLASTMIGLYGRSHSICGILQQAKNARIARHALTESVFGFGPKQASLFLRRIGYCADLAVLDVHVLDYLQLARGISVAPSRLGRLATYEEVESVFRQVASDFGHPIGRVDLATWLTMRVAKREAFL